MLPQEAYLLAIYQGLLFGYQTYEKLYQYFQENWEEAFFASPKAWMEAGIPPKTIEKFFRLRAALFPEKLWKTLQEKGISITHFHQEDYPAVLSYLSQIPSIIFYKGDLTLLSRPSLAIVGSRKISSYGEKVLHHFFKTFKDYPINIVSGLAYGVDILSHKLALQYNLPTIAVLGSGLDVIYPASHTHIAQKIAQEGLLLSEYPPGQKPRPQFFPVRNRIIAGISKGVLIIEAAKKSGSLITAQLALEQGKEIFAVPGSIFHEGSAGTNHLIAEGASPALDAAEMMETLSLHPQNPSLPPQKSKAKLTPRQKAILQCFNNEEVVALEDLIKKLPQFSTPEILADCALLELEGLLKKSGDTYFKNI